MVTSGDDTNANISDKTGQATQRNCLSKQSNYLIYLFDIRLFCTVTVCCLAERKEEIQKFALLCTVTLRKA